MVISQAQLRSGMSRTQLVQGAEQQRQQDVQQQEAQKKYEEQVAIQQAAQQKAQEAEQERQTALEWVARLAKENTSGYVRYNSAVGNAIKELSRTSGMSIQEAKNYYTSLSEAQPSVQAAAVEAGVRASQKEFAAQLPEGTKIDWTAGGQPTGVTLPTGEVGVKTDRGFEFTKVEQPKIITTPQSPFQVMAEQYQQKQIDTRQSIDTRTKFQKSKFYQWGFTPPQQKVYTTEESKEYLRTTNPLQEIFTPSDYPYWVGRATTKAGEVAGWMFKQASPETVAIIESIKIDTTKHPYIVPTAQFIKSIGDYALLGTFFSPAMAFGAKAKVKAEVVTVKTKEKDGIVYVRKFEDLFKKEGEEGILSKIKEFSKKIVKEPDVNRKEIGISNLNKLTQFLRERGLIKPETIVQIDTTTGQVAFQQAGFLPTTQTQFYAPLKPLPFAKPTITTYYSPATETSFFMPPIKGYMPFAGTIAGTLGTPVKTNLKTTAIPKSIFKTITLPKSTTSTVTIIKTTPSTRNIPRTNVIPKSISNVITIPKSISTTLNVPKTKTITKQIPRQVPRTRITPEPKIPKPIIFPISMARIKLKGKSIPKEVFSAFGRRYGKDILLGEFGSKQEAAIKLKGFLKGTLGAGGFIKKGEQKLKFEDIGLTGFEFRPTKRDIYRVIQRRGFRLGTRQERVAIRIAKKGKKGKKLKWW